MIKPSFIKGLNEEEMTFKDYIVEFLFYNKFSSFLRRFNRFVSRVIRWLPVLWNQEEWDYEYIYDLLAMKMKELRTSMSRDIWHDQKDVQKGIKQIDICLLRLDRWRNWPDYYDYPTEDIVHVPTENGCYRLEYTSEENEKQRLGAISFEQKNFDKFWKDFLTWHRGWWT